MNRDFQLEFLSYVESSGEKGAPVQPGEGHESKVEVTDTPENQIVPRAEYTREVKPGPSKIDSQAPVILPTSTSPYGTRRQKSGIVKTKNYCLLLGKMHINKLSDVKGSKKSESHTSVKAHSSGAQDRKLLPSSALGSPKERTQPGRLITSVIGEPVPCTSPPKMGTPDGSPNEKGNTPTDTSSDCGPRPKRNIIPKNMDTLGMSWREEKELKKALSASLRETKFPKTDDCSYVDGQGLPLFTTETTRPDLARPFPQKPESLEDDQSKLLHKIKKRKHVKKENLKLVMPGGKPPSDQEANNSHNSNSSNATNTKSFVLKHVRAQRKFAQGSRPSSPSTTPVKYKSITTPKKIIANKRAKTEDFLTFLCLRGSHSLPPHLEFFNYSESESLQSFPNTPRHSQDGSRPNTPAQASTAETATTPRAKTQNATGSLQNAPNDSPDREISLNNLELGVSPLVATASRSAGVVVGTSSISNSQISTTNDFAVSSRPLTCTSSNLDTISFPPSTSPEQEEPSASESSETEQSSVSMAVSVNMTTITAVGSKDMMPAPKVSWPLMCVERQASMVRMCEGVRMDGTSLQAVHHYQNLANIAAGVVMPGTSSVAKAEAATQTGDPVDSDADSTPIGNGNDNSQFVINAEESPNDDQSKVAIMQPSNVPALCTTSELSPLCQNMIGSDQILSITNLSTTPTAFVTNPQFMTTFLPSAVTLPNVTLPAVTIDPGTLQSLPAGLMLNSMSTCIQNTAVIQQPVSASLYGTVNAISNQPGPYGTYNNQTLASQGPTLLFPSPLGTSTMVSQQAQASSSLLPLGCSSVVDVRARCCVHAQSSATTVLYVSSTSSTDTYSECGRTALSELSCDVHEMDAPVSCEDQMYLKNPTAVHTKIGRVRSPFPWDYTAEELRARQHCMPYVRELPQSTGPSLHVYDHPKCAHDPSLRVLDPSLRLHASRPSLIPLPLPIMAPGIYQPPDSPASTPVKGAHDPTHTPKKDKLKQMPKKKILPVLGVRLLKKSKSSAQQGLTKKVTKARLATSQITVKSADTQTSHDRKKHVKNVKSGKVIKKASLQKQQGKKLVKRAKHTVAQSRLRPATRALTAHIESQKLELAKAGAEDYELLSPDDLIVLSSSPEHTSPKQSSQKDRSSSSDRKKRKGSLLGKELSSAVSSEKKSRVRSDESPVSTRSRTPLSGMEGQCTSGPGKYSSTKSHRRSTTDTESLDSSPALKVKGVKQPTKDSGPGRHKPASKSSGSTLDKTKSTTSSRPKNILPKSSFRQKFPQATDSPQIVQIPTYHPSAEQFQDPINYISTIRADAESYGMCCIVPPEGWKPECKMSEELRFTTQVQYVHRLQNRGGPSVLQMECIRKHLESQGITMEQPPLVGGNELDMPALSQAIRSCGGLQTVIDEEKWREVTQQLKVPKIFHERSQRLCEIYCRYLLSYDTLSEEERTQLEQQAAAEQQKNTVSYQDCMARGRSRTLGEFFRAARNLTEMWYEEEEPKPECVQADYWRIVKEGAQHVTSQIVHIDTKNCGSAFPTKKESPYSKHGWNFNMLQQNRDSVLRYIGQVSGVTVPMLHIGMLFSTCCWSREPHFLPYISYLHTGADQIWYCIPNSEEAKFKNALEELVPDLVDPESPIWLPEDAIMVSPEILVAHGVSLCHHVQKQGQFIVVFPEAFTATISCGYNITESINFATPNWIPRGVKASQILYESCEPDLFSIERLIFAIARDAKAQSDLHRIILPHLQNFIDSEISLRKKVSGLGLRRTEKLTVVDPPPDCYGKRRFSQDIGPDEENRCDISKKMCYLSAIVNESQGVVYCLEHGLKHIQRKSNRKACLMLYRFEEEELLEILSNVKRNVSASTRQSRRKSLKTS